MWEFKKNKSWKILVLVLFVVSYFVLKFWQWHWPVAEVILKGQTLKVLVASDPYHMYKGLSGRKSLGKYGGMIFIYDQKTKPAMVMRDMLFPLDIVWLDGGKVIDFASNLAPESKPNEELTRYYPRGLADLVLELPAGWADKYDLKIGDKLELAKDS